MDNNILSKIKEKNNNTMSYDIRVCRGPKRGTRIDEEDGLTIFRVFFSDSFEFRKANAFVTDCIIDGLGAKEIFELITKKDFTLQAIELAEKIKKHKKETEYKIRKFFNTYYFNYSK